VTDEVRLEEIALGEVAADAAAEAMASLCARLNDDSAHAMFDALRGWTWKALQARRRDEELPKWIDLLGRAAALLEDQWPRLAIKLEACMELVQSSWAAANSLTKDDLLRRKHVPELLLTLYEGSGRLHRSEIMERLALKGANLTRIAAPLVDSGWLQQETEGREALYRLTELGRTILLPDLARRTNLGSAAKPSQIVSAIRSKAIFDRYDEKRQDSLASPEEAGSVAGRYTQLPPTIQSASAYFITAPEDEETGFDLIRANQVDRADASRQLAEVGSW
jgi:DNA-binding MarR family transcriptional regulator